FFQYNPNKTGANNPDTNIAVPTIHKLTNCGIYNASSKDTIETTTTEFLLYFNIALLSISFTRGLTISFTIEDAAEIKNESAVEITVASRTINKSMIIGNGKTIPIIS